MVPRGDALLLASTIKLEYSRPVAVDVMHTSRHRANPSVAASVDLDVEGGGRLDEDYDGGWASSTASAWSATGPAAYTSSMSIAQTAQCHLRWARAGLYDANRWGEAARVAVRSPALRLSIVKGLALSASIAVLIFIFELAFFPAHLFNDKHNSGMLHRSGGDGDDDDTDSNVGSAGSVFWLYPLVAGAYFLAATWTMDVAQAAHKLKHGGSISLSAQSIDTAGLSRRLILESYRVILVVNYALISFGLQYIPYVGRILAFFFMSFIDAYYCFEQTWIARGWSIDRRMRFAESRWAYFVAFGLPSTLVSFFHPSGLLNLMLFMIVFPFCTVLAMLANPQPRIAPTSQSTLTPQNSGLPPSLANNTSLSPVIPPRVPIFWVTVKLYRLILRLFPHVIDANALSTPAMANGSAWRTAYSNIASNGVYNGDKGMHAPFLSSFGAHSTAGYGRSSPVQASGVPSANGQGSDYTGTSSSMLGKRGAMAAQVVDGVWGNQARGGSPAFQQGNGFVNGYGAHARANAGLASAQSSNNSPLLGQSQNGGSRFGNGSTAPNGYGTNAYQASALPAQSAVSTNLSNGQPVLRGAPGKKKD